MAARPGVASSRLTVITLGALLVKDQRHPGLALNRLKHLTNHSLQGFLKQNPWSVKTKLENIFWMKILQPSEPQLAMGLLPEGGCLVTGF